jgi:hypothetical protein
VTWSPSTASSTSSPWAANFTATIGGRVRQDDMLAIWPLAYPADTSSTSSPTPVLRHLQPEPGRWWWVCGGRAAASASAPTTCPPTADVGNPIAGTANCGAASATPGSFQTGWPDRLHRLQLGHRYGQYTYSSGGTQHLRQRHAKWPPSGSSNAAATSSVGISAYWQPSNSGWVPSISAGWGINRSLHRHGYQVAAIVSTNHQRHQPVLVRGSAVG